MRFDLFIVTKVKLKITENHDGKMVNDASSCHSLLVNRHFPHAHRAYDMHQKGIFILRAIISSIVQLSPGLPSSSVSMTISPSLHFYQSLF